MNISKIKISFEKFPLAVFDESGTLTHKNAAFEQICSARLKTKTDKIFSPETVNALLIASRDNRIQAIKCIGFDGYCALLSIPVSLVENAVIFLPSYYETSLQKGAGEIVDMISKQLLSESANKDISKNLARVRKTLYRNFERIKDTLEDCIDVSKLIDLTHTQLKLCTFPLGIKFNVNDRTNENCYLKTDLRALATEILCMFDIALYLNNDKNIDFDVSVRFNRVYLKFRCKTGKKALDEGIVPEKYILEKLSEEFNHRFDFSLNDGLSESTLIIPLTNKFEFFGVDENSAVSVFYNAIKFGI